MPKARKPVATPLEAQLRKFAKVRADVDRFAATRPDFDKHASLIEEYLRDGFDLHEAYIRAKLLKLKLKAGTRTLRP